MSPLSPNLEPSQARMDLFYKNHLPHQNRRIGEPPLPVTDTLWKVIVSRNWPEVLNRLSHCPWEASYRLKKKSKSTITFDRGATCLHAACCARAPLAVIEQMFEAFRPALFLQDKNGWTPLHLDLIYGNSEETTLYLVRQGGAHLARIQAQQVGPPFHLACLHRHSIPVLQELLKQDPHQLKVMTVEERPPGRFPGDLIWYVNNRKYALPSTSASSAESNPVLDRLYLCLAALRGDWELSRHTLHEVLNYQYYWCSDDRCRYIYQYLDRFPDSVRQWYQGELPLHTAAAQPLDESTLSLQSSTGVVPGNTQTTVSDGVISLLLQRFPQAAKIPDHKGRLALHRALACGRDWFQGGVKELLLANPAAAQMVDEHTGLLPVALAAFKQHSSDASSPLHPEPQLDTIYHVLCVNPSVLSG